MAAQDWMVVFISFTLAYVNFGESYENTIIDGSIKRMLLRNIKSALDFVLLRLVKLDNDESDCLNSD